MSHIYHHVEKNGLCRLDCQSIYYLGRDKCVCVYIYIYIVTFYMGRLSLGGTFMILFFTLSLGRGGGLSFTHICPSHIVVSHLVCPIFIISSICCCFFLFHFDWLLFIVVNKCSRTLYQ